MYSRVSELDGALTEVSSYEYHAVTNCCPSGVRCRRERDATWLDDGGESTRTGLPLRLRLLLASVRFSAIAATT